MSKNDNENSFLNEDEEGSSTGGQTGAVHFRYHDILSDKPRDDVLSPQTIQHLEKIHGEQNKALIDKARDEMKKRAAEKKGEKVYSAKSHGLGHGHSGQANRFKKHWISDLAKNSGKDKQVNDAPSLNEANTNDKAKNELQNKLENKLQNRLRNQYQNTPKPRPY